RERDDERGGEGDGAKGQRLPQNVVELTLEERRRDPESDGRERPAVDVEGERDLVHLGRRGEDRARAGGGGGAKARPRRDALSLLATVGVDDGHALLVRNERIEERGVVADARVEEGAQLRVLHEHGAGILAGLAGESVRALEIDLAGHELRLGASR